MEAVGFLRAAAFFPLWAQSAPSLMEIASDGPRRRPRERREADIASISPSLGEFKMGINAAPAALIRCQRV